MFKRLLSCARNTIKNSQISSKNIYLISKNGAPMGQRNLQDCLNNAKGLDLIQVSSSSPLGKDIPTVKEFLIATPVKKIEKTVKEIVKKKTIGLQSCIDDHDKCIKINKIIGYLEKGFQVRVTIGMKRSKQKQRPVSDLYKSILVDLKGYTCKVELEQFTSIEVVFFPKSL